MTNDKRTSPLPQDLIQWRARNRLSQLEAATAAMVSRRTWQNWESGSTSCPAGIWQLLQIRAREIAAPELRS